jgi:dipeptidase E
MCWFEYGITTSTGRPQPTRGLGLMPGSNSVHFDGESHRRPRYLEAVGAGEVPGGYGVDDGVGLRFSGQDLVELVSSRPRARAYRIDRDESGGVVETPLVPRRLPAPERAGVSPEVSELRRTSLARRHAIARGRSARLRP